MPTYRELLQRVKAEIAEIDAREAQALDGAALVDVREHDEWEEGRRSEARAGTRWWC